MPDLRLRKTDYPDDELQAWANTIRQAMDAGSDVFTYFKHEEDGFGPKTAKRLEAMVGSSHPVT